MSDRAPSDCLLRSWMLRNIHEQKLSQNFDFCACLSHNALKREAGGKKGKLLCCKRIFDRINPLTPGAFAKKAFLGHFGGF